MLLSAAILDMQLFIVAPQPYSLGLKSLTAVQGDQEAFEAAFDAYRTSFEDSASPLLQVIVGDFAWNSDVDLADLRIAEKQVSYY